MPSEPEEGGVIRDRDIAVNEAPSPFDLCVEMERDLVLDIATEQCSDGQREVILLHYSCNRSLAEVARGFGVSRSSVVQMHQRALETMREALRQMRISEFRDL